jgi:chlorophyll(ide) b reductase
MLSVRYLPAMLSVWYLSHHCAELVILTHHSICPSGATKAAFPQLAATLGRELDGTHVGVHVLSPGMMITELLLEGATSANKQAFNILCEHPETVAAFLVPRVRSAVSCGLNGTYTK